VEIVSALCLALIELDAENADFYKANAAAYIEELQVLDEKFEALKDGARYDTLIFADRYPFRYLCTDYGIEAKAAFSGCGSAVDPSLSVLSDLYKEAEALGVPAILYVENSTSAYAEDLAKKTGGQAMMLHSCHMLSKEEFGEKDYISIMEENLETLRFALGVSKEDT
jgi:zinc transport system substrate-binding protein